MAGAGYKLFAAGDILTATQVNTYLMQQSVMRFANAAARTTALSGVLSEGMVTYLDDTNVVEIYNGSAWVSLDDPNAIQNTIVDAKGDLISASAADTPARLAVGNNGETLVADSSTTTGLRYQTGVNQNSIINGGFDIWQRGTSLTVTLSAQPIADRFYNIISGTLYTSTASRQTTSDSTNLPFIQYCMRIARSSGQTGTSINYLMHSLETAESLRFAGRAVTVSFYARAGANFSGSITTTLYSGTGTDQNWATVAYTGQATVANLTPTLTTTWQRFSFTGTVASTATELAFVAAWTPSGTAGANDYYEITGIQLELGSVATTFKRAGGTLAGELAACQRYYFLAAEGNNKMLCNGSAFSATVLQGFVHFPVTMRTTPTLDATSGTNYFEFETSSPDSFDSLTIYRATTNGAGIFNNSQFAGTIGYGGQITLKNASAKVAFAAEL